MATYEMVIGLEVHVELATKTKIFCGCTTKSGGAPNTHTCPVCTGMPGTLPVANKGRRIRRGGGLATNCEITRYNKFDRKNYFYPDLPKAYQISQLYLPICRNGHVDIETAAGKKAVGIHEIHMEEDAGKLVHDPWLDETMVDYNRCGVPLLEIVSEPDMRSAEEVIAYLTKLRQTLQYLGVSDCRMQEGSLRADVNLSVRPVGQKEFGTRTEMKNINSFKGDCARDCGRIPPAGGADRGRRAGEAADPPLGRQQGSVLCDALQGERAGLPLLPPSRICRRWRFRRRLSTRCARASRSWRRRRLPAISGNSACRNTTRGF